MTLCKQNLVRNIASTNGYSSQESSQLLESLLETIKSTLESGEDIMISGFGKFQVKDKKTRRGRNPATRNNLPLDARRVVTFKCSGALKKRLNGRIDG